MIFLKTSFLPLIRTIDPIQAVGELDPRGAAAARSSVTPTWRSPPNRRRDWDPPPCRLRDPMNCYLDTPPILPLEIVTAVRSSSSPLLDLAVPAARCPMSLALLIPPAPAATSSPYASLYPSSSTVHAYSE